MAVTLTNILILSEVVTEIQEIIDDLMTKVGKESDVHQRGFKSITIKEPCGYDTFKEIVCYVSNIFFPWIF